MPCSVPSSPGRPCSTLSAASGLSLRKRRRDIAVDVDAADAIAGPLERVGAGLAGAQGNLALGRPASHQNRDVFHRLSTVMPLVARLIAMAGMPSTPIRLISHSRSMPECAFTRWRTVSPSVSISAALAPPRLIRKLQCKFGDLRAADGEAAAAGVVDSFHALCPGGFLKVEPPVRLRGWLASRFFLIARHFGGDLVRNRRRGPETPRP